MKCRHILEKLGSFKILKWDFRCRFQQRKTMFCYYNSALLLWMRRLLNMNIFSNLPINNVKVVFAFSKSLFTCKRWEIGFFFAFFSRCFTFPFSLFGSIRYFSLAHRPIIVYSLYLKKRTCAWTKKLTMMLNNSVYYIHPYKTLLWGF